MCPRDNPWLANTCLDTHVLAHVERWPWHLQEEDFPAHTFHAPPLWEPPIAVIFVTPLPASKALCNPQELRQRALMAMEKVIEPGSAVYYYYSDAAVDSDSGTTGAALSWRTSDHCSTPSRRRW